jgi:ElaB/YqjD/DUF883 family membrane-anchored ribosome-binding protein
MKETTMSEAFRNATEGLQNGAATAASEAERQVRENGPRLIRSARKSYDDANDYVGDLVENRSLAALLAVGALGLVIGLFASRR